MSYKIGSSTVLEVNDSLNNTSVGSFTLSSNTTGTYNTATGKNALEKNTSGVSNTAVGSKTLINNTTGNSNTALGRNAMYQNTDGDSNVAIGESALYAGSGGNNNVAIGRYAMSQHVSGTNNICIGYGSACSTNTISNEVSIYNGTVHARFQGSASSWTFPSDERDKTAIEDLTLGLDFITRLRPRKFQWNLRHQTEKEGKEASGFIAQEVLALVEATDSKYTDLVNTSNENQYSLAQTNLIPMLVNAIKELTARLEILEAR